MVALDDDNQAAFAYYDSNQNLQVYTWTNGTATWNQKIKSSEKVTSADGSGEITFDYTQGNVWSARVLTTTGKLWGTGQMTAPSNWAPFFSEQSQLQFCDTNGNAYSPNQWKQRFDSDFGLVDATEDKYCQTGPRFLNANPDNYVDGPPDENTSTYASQIAAIGGSRTRFINFTPTKINSTGWAIGTRGSNSKLWNGSGFTDLPGPGVGINKQGYVTGIASSQNSAWVLQGGNSTQQIKTLLPSDYQNQITNIKPIFISNANSSGDYYIKFSADNLEASGTGASKKVNRDFLLKLKSSGDNEISVLKMPDGVNAAPVSLNASGIQAAIGTLPKTKAKKALHLLPVDISFEKVSDNWDIEDNKDKDGNWMPGKGKRMFVDAKTPQETAMRDTVYVKVKSLPPGWKIRLKSFDVDDPTPDSLDPKHDIDSNDTATIKRGNDNRGYDNLSIQQPPYFVSSGDVTEDCTVDTDCVAKLTNGELPKLQMTDHPGDNVRVAVIFLKPDGTPMAGQDLSRLQVTDSTQPGYVKPSDESAQGFNGGLSSMLTVWRKLNIEVDSMEAVATSGSEKNFEEGTVQAVTSGPAPGQSTVTVNILLTGPANRYENGFLTVGGASYEVVSNTDDPTNFFTGDQVVVKGTVPSSAVNQSFTIVDDDDRYLAQFGLPPSLPRNQHHEDIIKGIRSKFAPAYIQVEDANALGWNTRQTINFQLNSYSTGLGYPTFTAAKDLNSKTVFWARLVVCAYQAESISDADPSTEDAKLGSTPYSALGNVDFGYSILFMETIRDDAFRFLSLLPYVDTVAANKAIKNLNEQLLGTCAHEIGHGPGNLGASAEHAEGGLMDGESGGNINQNFKPATINRFRNVDQW